MNKSNKAKLILFLTVGALLIPLTFYPQALSQNFRLFTDAYDGIGGPARSASFLVRIGVGGQTGTDAVAKGADFYAWSGYVHTAAFVHGDCDGDGTLGLADAVYLINYALKGGPEPIPLETGDMDCANNYVDLADVVYLINYLFRGGPAPCNL
jgi:hypothetical protein